MKSKKGFTLVELLLYASILAIVGGMLTGVMITSIRTQNRDASTNEVTEQLNFVIGTVQRLVRESSLVEEVYESGTSTQSCEKYCALKLRMEDSDGDPEGDYKNVVIISSDGDGVYIKEGYEDPIPLTTNEILIDNFIFTKTEVAGGHAIVQVDATFSRNTQNPQLATTRSSRSAVSRASAATFDSDLLPNQDGAFTLGQTSPNKRWSSLFLSDNLHVWGNITVSGDCTGCSIWEEGSGGDIYYNGGDVGIGHPNPAAKLHVATARSNTIDNANQIAAIGGEDVYTRFGSLYGTPNWGSWIQVATDSGIPLQLLLNPNGGNVGIGTANPGEKLDIVGNVAVNGVIRGQFASGSGDVLNIGNDSKLTDINVANTTGLYGVQDTTQGHIKLGSSGPTLSGVNGKVGIGTTNPGAKLHVVGGTTWSDLFSAANNGTVNLPAYGFSNNNDTGYYLFNQSTGETAITSDSSGVALFRYDFIKADSGVPILPRNDNAQDLGSSGLRWRTVYRVSESGSSDIRLKENVQDLSYGLDFIKNLRPVEYQWKDWADTEGGGKDGVWFGLIAQDIVPLLDDKKYELIHEPQRSYDPIKEGQSKDDPLDFEKDYYAMNYEQLHAITIKAVQELNDQLDQLKEGVLAVKELVLEKLTADTVRVNHTEYVDQATGEIYCTWVENGEFVKELGECN